MYSCPHIFGTHTPILLGIYVLSLCCSRASNKPMNVPRSALVVALDTNLPFLGPLKLV